MHTDLTAHVLDIQNDPFTTDQFVNQQWPSLTESANHALYTPAFDALIGIAIMDGGATLSVVYFSLENSITARPARHTSGYYSSVAGPGQTDRLGSADTETQKIRAFAYSRRAWFNRVGCYLGYWVDGATVYRDVSCHFADRAEALRHARINGQKCVWDMAAGVSIFTMDEAKTA